MITYARPMTNEYLTPEDQSVIESSFNRGAVMNQEMRNGSQDRGRNSSMQSAGLNQPVASGTVERVRPSIYG